jgi:hypothetical protein
MITKFNFNRHEGFIWLCTFIVQRRDGSTFEYKIKGSRRKVRRAVRAACASEGVASPV